MMSTDRRNFSISESSSPDDPPRAVTEMGGIGGRPALGSVVATLLKLKTPHYAVRYSRPSMVREICSYEARN